MKGIMDEQRLTQVEKALFHRALKLQIGCGAEPTLYQNLADIIKKGKQAGIPYISLTTNGQQFATGKADLFSLVESGLDELTLSIHGTDKSTYEYLMPGAKFENLLKLVEIIRNVKHRYPNFTVRVNFTVNSLNVDNLRREKFWALWGGDCVLDIVQLRPVQNLGESEWKDFNLTPLKDKYKQTIGDVIQECKNLGITCIAPTIEQIETVDAIQDAGSAALEDFSYCYVSPDSCYKPDFDLQTDTYETFHRRNHSAYTLLLSALRLNKARTKNTSKKLNYNIK